MRIRTGVALAASVALAAAANANAATFTVTRVDDPVPGACDSDCSLREAVLAADAGSGGDTISIPAGRYGLRIAGPGEDAAATGDLDLTRSVTISGSGARTTVIDAGGGDRVFDVKAGVTASISDVTITGGFINGNGGGIASAGVLTLVRDSVSGNHALLASNGNGGGIHSNGTLTLTQTEISRNDAYNGGGINFGGTLSLTNSTVSGNTAGGPGATGGGGGGISGSGGATLTATVSTIVGNSAFNGLGSGGGISASMATLGGTIVANNLAHESNQSATYADNCSVGTISTQGSNLSDATDCKLVSPSDQQNVPVLLGPLADNGGETSTHALPAASKAVNASAICPGADQRGATRKAGVPCDVGAYEVAPPTPGGSPATSVTSTSAVLEGTAESTVLLTAYRFAWTVEGTTAGGTTALQWVAPNTTAHLSARLAGLAPGTTYRYELVGVNADGTGSSTPITFTTPDRTRPVLTLLRVAPGIFRAGKGTTISFSLSEAATTTLRFDRVLPGMRRGKSCVPRTARRRGRACTRYLPVAGSVAIVGTLGANSTRFDAKVAGRTLRPSAYRLRATPTDLSGNVGKTVIAAFRVRR